MENPPDPDCRQLKTEKPRPKNWLLWYKLKLKFLLMSSGKNSSNETILATSALRRISAVKYHQTKPNQNGPNLDRRFRANAISNPNPNFSLDSGFTDGVLQSVLVNTQANE